ncbi:MAG: KEOPS complex subunit Pcc1 [Candidatus Methanoperedens sp.]
MMRIKGKLTLKSEKAEELVSVIAQSLAPDNVSEMKSIVDGDSVMVMFEGDKVGTILASVDDYLMNAKIASDMLKIK